MSLPVEVHSLAALNELERAQQERVIRDALEMAGAPAAGAYAVGIILDANGRGQHAALYDTRELLSAFCPLVAWYTYIGHASGDGTIKYSWSSGDVIRWAKGENK